jgi:hypothetical protein
MIATGRLLRFGRSLGGFGEVSTDPTGIWEITTRQLNPVTGNFEETDLGTLKISKIGALLSLSSDSKIISPSGIPDAWVSFDPNTGVLIFKPLLSLYEKWRGIIQGDQIVYGDIIQSSAGGVFDVSNPMIAVTWTAKRISGGPVTVQAPTPVPPLVAVPTTVVQPAVVEAVQSVVSPLPSPAATGQPTGGAMIQEPIIYQQPLQTSILSSSLFGIPILYLAIGAAGLLFFLSKRGEA